MPDEKKETKQEEKAEEKKLKREQKEKIVPAFKPITIRDYSKVVFFYPLFLYSGVTPSAAITLSSGRASSHS